MSYLSVGESAAVLGVSISTMRRWEDEGKLHPHHRTLGGHRRYAWDDLRKQLGYEGSTSKEKRVVCYARVSSHDQKSDLVRQGERLIEWCAEQKHDDPMLISDLGSGLNYKKKGLKTLLRMIALGQLYLLFITHKDRLLRFGSELLFELCRLRGIEVVVMNEVPDQSYEQRLSADVIELMTVFSARLYGARSHKNRSRAA